MSPHLRSSAARAGDEHAGLFTGYPTLRGPVYGTLNSIKLSGTSMAAAVVSGTVALMIEDARATFGSAPTPNALKAMLQASALPLSDASGAADDPLVQGAGGLNTAGAVALAHALNPTVALNSNWLVTGITKSTTVDSQQIVWGDHIVWGDVFLQP